MNITEFCESICNWLNNHQLILVFLVIIFCIGLFCIFIFLMSKIMDCDNDMSLEEEYDLINWCKLRPYDEECQHLLGFYD